MLFGCRAQQLESEVATQAEKISQLLVEKEKAVADLIAIRKLNRTIEKYDRLHVGVCQWGLSGLTHFITHVHQPSQFVRIQLSRSQQAVCDLMHECNAMKCRNRIRV